MDKILFSNSFKNLMVALGAKTSDSSYAVPLINKTSGAPQGYMEMSALASVLGVGSLGVGSKNNTTKIKISQGYVQSSDVIHIGSLVSLYRSILVLGSDIGGVLCFSIARSSSNDYAVYGQTNGLKVYISGTNLYLQCANGHLIKPFAINIGENGGDTVIMKQVDSLPPGAVEVQQY